MSLALHQSDMKLALTPGFGSTQDVISARAGSLLGYSVSSHGPSLYSSFLPLIVHKMILRGNSQHTCRRSHRSKPGKPTYNG